MSLATRAIPRIGLIIIVLATIAVAVGATVRPADAQLTPIEDEPGLEAPGLGDIVGSPEAGPEPEDAGDRGGWAQLTLAVVIAGGVLFIGSRILKESRAGRGVGTGQASPPPETSGPSAV